MYNGKTLYPSGKLFNTGRHIVLKSPQIQSPGIREFKSGQRKFS